MKDRLGNEINPGDTVIYGRIEWGTHVQMTKEKVEYFTAKMVKLEGGSFGLVKPSNLILYNLGVSKE